MFAKPNILLIVSEDNGPELGCYGDPYAQTSVLDQLAKDGVRFERACVPYSVCSPSRACFLTGLYPHQNGQIGLATHKFATYPDIPNVFTLLKGKGYRTGLIGKLHVNPKKAFPVDYRAIKGANFGKRNMKDYAEAADKFFTTSEDPFFLSINYPDAHFPLHRQQFGLPETPIEVDEVKPLPWVGADSPRLRKFTADYYNCMRRLDDGIGMLLERLEKAGKLDNTLVIYIGDHGAQFSRGKCSVYEAGLRIPFIVCWPGNIKGGQVRRELVSTLDILPTILDAAATEPGTHLPGRALQPLLAGETVPWRKHLFGFTTGAAPAIFHLAHSVRSDRFKLISNPTAHQDRPNLFAKAYLERFNTHFAAGTSPEEIDDAPEHVQTAYRTFLHPPRYELYDLESDPNEFHNLAEEPAHLETKQHLIRALTDWQLETHDPFSDSERLQAFVDYQREMGDLSYRKDKDFRWPYLDQFQAWRQKYQGKPVYSFDQESNTGYRIPSIIRSKHGRLLAFCERREGLHDHAKNDIVLRSSDDEGMTWNGLQVLADEGDDSLNDPRAVLLNDGRILLHYKRYPRGYHSRKSAHTEMADAGYEGPRTCRSYQMESSDEGRTWTEPHEITRQIRRPGMVSCGGPGIGIQLQYGEHRGRIVFPLYQTLPLGNNKRNWKTCAVYSDDGGKTWERGDNIDEGNTNGVSNEAQLVELSDGAIMISARNQGGEYRKVAVSRDGGAHFEPYWLAYELKTPACMASVLRYESDFLLHTIPYGTGRADGRLFVSVDDGKSWQDILTIEPGEFAYSCLVKLADGDVGCFYETRREERFEIHFKRIPKHLIIP
jgi:N-sulfoglucosamine sulfohydrolase